MRTDPQALLIGHSDEGETIQDTLRALKKMGLVVDSGLAEGNGTSRAVVMKSCGGQVLDAIVGSADECLSRDCLYKDGYDS
jgi:hypothetical protein